MKDTIKFSFVLFMICLVAASSLAFIFKITEPQIIKQRKLEEERVIKEALPQSPATIEKVEEKDITFYKAKDARGNLIAYVFIAEGRGYSSNIKTVVSMNPKAEIIVIKNLEHLETPGIGSRITEDEFLSQFKNKDVNKKFDTITGATISSRAVIDSIKKKVQKILTYGR